MPSQSRTNAGGGTVGVHFSLKPTTGGVLLRYKTEKFDWGSLVSPEKQLGLCTVCYFANNLSHEIQWIALT